MKMQTSFAILFLVSMAAAKPSRLILYQVVTDRFSPSVPGACTDQKLAKDSRLGGTLKGLEKRLDYIQALGVNGLWMSPLYAGLPEPKNTYHGYAPLNMDRIDPHFGNEKDLKQLMEKAEVHKLSVVFDFVFNHTADVIRYKECSPCPFRNRPYAPKEVIPYKKTPNWLNDSTVYHHNGELDMQKPESWVLGDVAGLDDLKNENPEVQKRLLQIHSRWVDDFAPQGIRIDTARNLDPGFLKKIIKEFAPRVDLYIENRAETLQGYQPEPNSRVTSFNFPFFRAFREFLQSKISAKELALKLRSIFLHPVRWMNFISSHDLGRLGWLKSSLQITDWAQFLETAHLLQFVLSEKSLVYYGDEQGFLGADGNGEYDEARENLFGLCHSPYGEGKDQFDKKSIYFLAVQKAIRQARQFPMPEFSKIQGTDDGLLIVPFKSSKKSLVFNFSNQSQKDQNQIVRAWGWRLRTSN